MRKAFCFFVVCFLLCHFLHAQNLYKGVVVDAQNAKPIAYVNIGIIAKGLGTVSNEEGVFQLPLEFTKYSSTDSLQFSSIGYKTLKKAVTDLQLASTLGTMIRLKPETIALDEVVVAAKRQVFEKELVGYGFEDARIVGYWKDDVALGGELATKIEVKKAYRRLKEYSFRVLENPSDSLLLRINIYNGKEGIPKSNLSNANILHLLKTKNGKVTIDLRPYHIVVYDDFIVSMELLQVYGEKIGLVLGANANEGISYKRYASQDTWERIRGSVMAYEVNSDVELTGKRAIRKTKKDKKKLANARSISGGVFFQGKPLTEVQVTNLNTLQKVETNEKGRYALKAEAGDVIEFNHLDMNKVLKKVTQKPFVNASMERKEN